jgi:hypothetical protein
MSVPKCLSPFAWCEGGVVNRRAFVKAFAGVSAGLISGLAYSEQAQRYDILIKNGELRDPGRGIRQRADLAILNGTIAEIAENIAGDRALDVVDASGQYVTPGLIDLHTHCFWGGSGIGISPIRLLPVQERPLGWMPAALATTRLKDSAGLLRFLPSLESLVTSTFIRAAAIQILILFNTFVA